MNCITPRDAIESFFNHLEKDITSLIDHFYESDSDELSMIEPFKYSDWESQRPFIDMEFEFEWASNNFKTVLSNLEMFSDKSFMIEFETLLKERLINLICQQINFHKEIELQEKQEEFNHEMEEAV